VTTTTEAVPQPLAVDAAVDVDFAGRALSVRLPDAAGGHERSLWRSAHQALLAAERSGWRSRVPTVWAHTDRRRDIAHGRPGEFASLRFTFARVPDSAFSELVGRPRLAAIVVIDRSAGHFMSVRFLHREALPDAAGVGR
jgi:hypothetical protein